MIFNEIRQAASCINIGGRIAATCAALSVVASVSAQETPSSGDYVAAGETFIRSLTWPEATTRIGFKSLTLGSVVDLDDRSAVSIYKSKTYLGAEIGMNLSGEHAIFCTGKIVVLSCHFQFWKGKIYPAAFNDLKTAFGEEVKVRFTVVPPRPIPVDAAEGWKYGAGRIVEVIVENEKTGDTYTTAAINHFTQLIGAPPIRRQKFSNAKSIYSPACAARVAEIEAKPITALTLRDNADYERCEQEALKKIIGGNLRNTRETSYLWTDPASKIGIALIDKMENLGGIVRTRSATIQMSIDLEKPLAEFNTSMARINDGRRAERDAVRRNDF